MKFRHIAVFFLLSCLMAYPQAAPETSAAPLDTKLPPTPASSASQAKGPELNDRAPHYVLRAGDVLELTFEFAADFNQTVTIQPDGYISLRGISELNVGGLTLPKATSLIVGSYESILNKPSISVVLKDFEKPYYLVTGQVNKPGKYDLRSETTLTQAIATAGGFNDMAKHSQVLLYHRVSNEWMEARLYNVKEMLKKGTLQEDPLVHPGDMVVVPQSAYSKIRRYIPAPGVGVSMSPTTF